MSEHRIGTSFAERGDTGHSSQTATTDSSGDQGETTGPGRWKFSSAVDAARFLGSATLK